LEITLFFVDIKHKFAVFHVDWIPVVQESMRGKISYTEDI